MFHQFAHDGDELVDGGADEVTDINEVIAAIGIGGKVLQGAESVVGALLLDGWIETALTQLRLTGHGHTVVAIMLQCINHFHHHLVGALQTLGTNEREVVGRGVIFRILVVLAATEGADGQAYTGGTVLAFV